MLGNFNKNSNDGNKKNEERMEKQVTEFENTIEEEFPDYEEEWSEVDSIWMFAKVFRWFLNLFFLAIPWSFISQILLGYNLFFNIKWNFLWAGGNVWLLFNTIYVV